MRRDTPSSAGIPLGRRGHSSGGLWAHCGHPRTLIWTYTVTREEPMVCPLGKRGWGRHQGSHGSPSAEPQTVGPSRKGSLPLYLDPTCLWHQP